MTAPTPEEVAGLCERLRNRWDWKVTDYAESCEAAAAAIESIARERDRLSAEVERLNHLRYWVDGVRCVLTDKELTSAVITAVMSGNQSERDAAVLKLQGHILRVEEERDQREAECERWAQGNTELARVVATVSDCAQHRATIERLEGELENCKRVSVFCGQQYAKDREEIMADNDRLREALRAWEINCTGKHGSQTPCSAALAPGGTSNE